ncbi:hypothetical protein AB0420_33090 [Streptomyces caelestis]|uniref:Uncharacterized protein n=1 Tax=Streptomyces heliomycini TaxID=284032 RepID=A0ABV5LCX6_9ACTN|nr:MULTISPECIES: hypothetical protein [Streptomyces]
MLRTMFTSKIWRSAVYAVQVPDRHIEVSKRSASGRTVSGMLTCNRHRGLSRRPAPSGW